MALNYLKTDSKSDKKFNRLMEEAKSYTIEEPKYLYDYSKRLFNTYGISEEFINYIYRFGYIDGCNKKNNNK